MLFDTLRCWFVRRVTRGSAVHQKMAGENQGAPLSVDPQWVAHAHPLQQATIRAQGTRHSDRSAIIAQLEAALARLKSGDASGSEHDDDFGYSFDYTDASPGPSFFDAASGADQRKV